MLQGGDGPDDDDSSDQGLPPSHRNIPSWDEAIGMIVDANLQTRTERRRSSPQRSGNSRGQRGGRGRGRRSNNS
jgi:hypothetical protein